MSIQRRLVLILFILAFISYDCWRHPPHLWTWMQTLGACLFIPAVLFFVAAHVQLGNSFAIRAQARTLVTHGVYSKIRNPIYFFGSIILASLIIYSGELKFLLVFALIIPLQVWRARREARVLEEKFGEEYRAYRRQTWF